MIWNRHSDEHGKLRCRASVRHAREHELESVGLHAIKWRNTVRRRRLWRLADCATDVIYWYDAELGYMTPVCRAADIIA